MAVDIDAHKPVPALNTDSKDAPTIPNGKPENESARKPRPRRPNFHEIHAKPLPLDVYPLPAFIPHNPISIVRIAVSLLSHSLFPPKSHSVVHRAYFSPQTQSVHVTDPVSIRALWEQGFWGKGSLSRSEPQWLAGEKKKRGIAESKTSAEVTQNRREERKQFKLERARAQREAIEQQLRREGKLDADGSLEELVDEGQVAESPRGTIYTPEAEDVVTVSGDAISSEISKKLTEDSPSWETSETVIAAVTEIQDQEHLQLTTEEAFYLAYSLGALSVVAAGEQCDEVKGTPFQPYPTWYLLRLYAAHANSPCVEEELLQLKNAYLHPAGVVSPTAGSIVSVEPDNQFVLRYVVYHHFRSLGWVVRPGIKFAVDYLLYLRGPAFHHAEFAIMIIPSYSDPYWAEARDYDSNIENRKRELEKKDWWWLHRINRVQTAVFKTLVLVYVEIPPPWDQDSMQSGWKVDVGSVLKKYTVREVVVRRWSPNRNRD
jgi:tRNA-splicing endonuclease subunit Sen2